VLGLCFFVSTPPLTLTTAMEMLPLTAATSFEHGGTVPPDPYSLD